MATNIACECQNPRGRVLEAVDVVLECLDADGGVGEAFRIAEKCFKTDGGIKAACVVVEEGESATRRVLEPGRAEQKRAGAGSCIFVCDIQREGTCADTGVEAAGSEGPERQPTDCRIRRA